MKTRILLAFLGIVLWSCQESVLDPDITPIVDPAKKTVTIVASATKGGAIDPSGEANVYVGDTKIYKGTPENGYTTQKVTLDGVEQSFTDNTVTVIVKDDSKKRMDLRFQFIEKNILLMSQKSWEFVSKERRNEWNDGPWLPLYLVEGKQINAVFSFGLDGICRGYFDDGQMCSGPSPWSLIGNELTIGDVKFQVVELNPETGKLVYIWKQDTGWSYRYTYQQKK